MLLGDKITANIFNKKIKDESRRSQLQPVVFIDEDKSIAALKKNQLDTYDELESYKRLRSKRIKKSIARMFAWILVVLFIPVFVFFTIVIINPKAGHNFFGYSVYMVTSTSMVGVFDEGDCIIVKSVSSEKDIGVGTDITFVRQSDGEIVTHRIIDVLTNENGETEYITKGVNNPNADTQIILFEDILGKRVLTAATLGNIIEYFRTPQGIVTFVITFILVIFAINVAFKLSDDIRAVGMK